MKKIFILLLISISTLAQKPTPQATITSLPDALTAINNILNIHTSQIGNIQSTSNVSSGASYSGKTLLLFDGNSITQGRGARETTSPDDFASGPYPSQTRTSLISQFSSATLTTKNFGVSGQRLTDVASDVATQSDVLFNPATYDRNVYILEAGSNDIADEGASAQTVIDRYVAICKARRAKGFLIVAVPIFPRTSNMGSGISNAEFENRRNIVNNYFKFNYLQFADVFADITALTAITFPDGTHPDAAGYVIMGNYIASKIAPLMIQGFNPQSIAFLLSGATSGGGSTTTGTGSGTLVTGTVLSLRGQGANNSTTIIDEAGHTFVAKGNARISTDQFKFGSSSIFLDGSAGTYLQSPTITDWNFAMGDFTMEAWLYKTSAGSGYPGVFCRGDGANNMWTLSYPNFSPRIELFVNQGGTNYQSQNLSVNTDMPLNVWTHVALVGQNGIRKFYQNGVLVGTAVTNQNLETNNTNSPLNVGGFPALGNMDVDVFVGYLHARITKSALYTGNFTPPASF